MLFFVVVVVLDCFLQLIALNEGVIMTKDEINTFIHPFKPDIRQSTLQLQYVLSTGEINEVIFYKTKYSNNYIYIFINLFKIYLENP